MDENNRVLLTKVVSDRLECALSSSEDPTKRKLAFAEAMEAVNKQIEVDKLEASHQEHIEKQRAEEKRCRREDEFKRVEARKARNTQIGIFVAGLIVSPIIEVVSKTLYANHIAKLEEFDTFTSEAGRGIASWFRWKN